MATPRPSRQLARLQQVVALRVKRAQQAWQEAERQRVARCAERDAQAERAAAAERRMQSCAGDLASFLAETFQPSVVQSYRGALQRLATAHAAERDRFEQLDLQAQLAEVQASSAHSHWARQRARAEALEQLHQRLARGERLKDEAIDEVRIDEEQEAQRRSNSNPRFGSDNSIDMYLVL